MNDAFNILACNSVDTTTRSLIAELAESPNDLLYPSPGAPSNDISILTNNNQTNNSMLNLTRYDFNKSKLFHNYQNKGGKNAALNKTLKHNG